MATFTIEIPDNPDDIKGTIEALSRQLIPLNAQREAILGAIESVRKRCSHKNAYRGKDISGCSEGKCYDCGYVW